MKVKFKKMHPDAKIPAKHYDDDFCYDLYATSCEEIAPNVYKYGLGLAFQIDEDYIKSMRKDGYILSIDIRPRSSIWKTGMIMTNSVGTVDEGYTNEICAIFYHILTNLQRYSVGDRVAQLKIGLTPKIDFVEVEKLNEKERGLNGIGSTGRK